MAISNNLPQFTDEIKKLKDANVELEASGKPAVSIVGQLAKAVLSWQTLISVGITLLTLYGSKLIDYIFDTNKATKSQLDWNKELEKSEKNIDGLVKRIEDANLAIRKSSGALTIEEENAFKIQREIFAEREKAYNTFIEQQKTLRTELAKARGEDPLKLRPWLKNFNMGETYTKEMVRSQIQATYDVGLTSWMMWDPSNTYPEGSLLIE